VFSSASKEQMLDENLLSIGRRTAIERAAYLIAFVWARAAKVNLVGKANSLLPITQQHVADTLGLSRVHTNRTLRKLVDRKLLTWRDGGCEVLDLEGLTKVARWQGLRESVRPLV
jgi:CRP-like cAMP-binding protein